MPKIFLVNLFLMKFVRISGFSSIFSAIAVFLALSAEVPSSLKGSIFPTS